MNEIVKSIFNPLKQATAASGQLGATFGKEGARFGHLGASYGHLGASQEAFNPKDHFDTSTYYKPENHYDPTKLVKRY